MKTEGRWYFPFILAITVCYFATLAISPVVAASLGDIPVTAEYAAGMRAIAAMDPDEKIRNPDYMAQQFLTPGFWFWGSLSKDYQKSKKFIQFYRVGGYYASNACTKHTQNIPDELKKAGYDPGRKTFFIWEGVTMYISEAAVDGTLRFIASQSPPGSSVVFDYMPAGAIQGDLKRYPDVRRLSFWVAHKGEPFIFGMDPEASGPFVNQRGLKVLSDLGPKDLEKRYLTRKDGSLDGPCCSAFRIMHAAVP